MQKPSVLLFAVLCAIAKKMGLCLLCDYSKKTILARTYIWKKLSGGNDEKWISPWLLSMLWPISCVRPLTQRLWSVKTQKNPIEYFLFCQLDRSIPFMNDWVSDERGGWGGIEWRRWIGEIDSAVALLDWWTTVCLFFSVKYEMEDVWYVWCEWYFAATALPKCSVSWNGVIYIGPFSNAWLTNWLTHK